MNTSQLSDRESVAGKQIQSLLNEHDVAKIIRMSLASLRRWRLLGQGPRYLKLGSACRYKPDDVAAWLDSRPAGGGHQEDVR